MAKNREKSKKKRFKVFNPSKHFTDTRHVSIKKTILTFSTQLAAFFFHNNNNQKSFRT